MNMRPILNAVAAAGLVTFAGAPGPAWADDAEIYVNQRDLPEASQPLVMFSLDYRPNLGSTVCQNGECQFLVDAKVLPQQDSYTFFDMLRGALKLVMEPLSGVRVGLMLNHDDSTTGRCGAGPTGICSNGGYIAMGFEEFKVDDTSNDVTGAKAMFHSVLETMPVPGDSPSGASHLYQGRELFYEFYRYLTGAPVWNGMKGFTSFDHNTGDNNINIVPEYAARWAGEPSAPINGFGPDPTIIRDADGLDPNTGAYSNVGTYISPLTTLGDCSKIFTVNFMFQVSQQEANSDDEIARYPGGIAKGSGPGGGFAPMIEYLNRTDLAPGIPGDQKVISYFLGTEPQVRNNTFAAYATAGGTGSALPITENPEELVALLNDVFKQILSVSTTFTAAALPVNSFDRAQLLSDVFLGLFQPQVDDFPQNNSYWWGNVKKLKLGGLGDANEAVQLVDANNNPAVAADGRIRYTAQTFWTDSLGDDVLDAGRDPDPNAVSGYDGRSVNRGGAGHKVPGFPRRANYNPQRQNSQPEPPGPRRLFFDSGNNSLAALEATDTLAADASLQAAIGTNDSAEALEVLKFMRGLDPIAADPDVIPLEWMFGSVVHSRPLPVNYGARDGHGPGNPLIYIAAGGNDGALRFIRNTDSSGNQVGQESWAFVPTEVMGNIRRIVRQQGPEFSGDSTIYGFDGPPTLYIEDKNADGTIDHTVGDKAILYAGLRRGGRAYYALDVSNPEAPELLWRIVGGVTPEFEELGWTFSQPRTGKVRIPTPTGIGTDIVPVVIFGGGFDRAYDNQLASVSGPTGSGIYIVNALTGEFLAHIEHAGMQDSIPSPVSAVDTSGDGLVDRIYVGDLGGRVWRVDLVAGESPTSWSASLLADLGRHAAGDAAGEADDRRFFHAPDIVQSSMLVDDDAGTVQTVKFHAVLIGSGDRANPLYNAPANWFFMIRDTNLGVLASAPDMNYGMGDLEDVTTAVDAEIPTTRVGWKLELATPGEKSLASSLTVGNTVFFTTYIPPGAVGTDVCGPAEGNGRLYAVSLKNAGPVFNRDAAVDGDEPFDPSDRWTDLRAAGIPAEAQYIPAGNEGVVLVGVETIDFATASRWRTFWYLEEDPVQ